MKKPLSILLIFWYFTIVCQEKSNFDKIYVKTYLETSQKNFSRATEIADSLYKSSSDPLLQTKSLMLSATLYQQKGKYGKSVDFALKAENIVDKTDNVSWKARISGFLATQYRILKLYSISEKYADQTIKFSKEIKDSLAARHMMVLMLQEKAYLELDRKNYHASIKYVKSSQKLLSSLHQDKDFFLANNSQILGLNYFFLNDFKASLVHYDHAVKYSKNLPESFLNGLIYNGIANNFISLGKFQEAEIQLRKAEKIANETQYLQLKNEIYETAQRLYLARKKIDKVEDFKHKQDSVKEQLDIETGRFINNEIKNADDKNEAYSRNSTLKNVLIILTAVLLLSSIIFFIFYRKAERNTYRRFKTIIAEMNRRAVEKEQTAQKAIQIKPFENMEESNRMTSAAEGKILDNLKQFENSELYLKSDISLPFLASYCKTNTKYLSRIINNQKGMDFNNYINSLRINYIVEKLTNDPEYRKYKIAALADETGFSSPNKFSTIFKKVTSISPSVFIKYLHDQKPDS